MKTQQPNLSPLSLVGDFHAVWPGVYTLRFTSVGKQNWVCCLFVGLFITRSGPSGVMSGTLVLESGKLGSNSEPVKALSLWVSLS